MSIIRTIKQFNEYKFKEKNSVFIGQVYPVSGEEEVTGLLNGIKKKYYDATHHCFCYKFENSKFRYSDDGEPSGTAGTRILNAIEHFNVLSVLVVVIRYYGGTKLGVGPLGKAYYDAAENALSSALIVEKRSYNKTTFSVDFNNMNHVYRILSHHDIKNIETLYSEDVKINCFVNSDELKDINNKLTELTNGNISIKTEETAIFL